MSHDVAHRGLLVFEPTAAGAGVYRVTPNRGLVAFDDLTAGVAVVGVGERLHRSGGLARARARLAERAVTSLGFGALAMEGSWVEGRAIDAQLHVCAAGSASTVVVRNRDSSVLCGDRQPRMAARHAGAPAPSPRWTQLILCPVPRPC